MWNVDKVADRSRVTNWDVTAAAMDGDQLINNLTSLSAADDVAMCFKQVDRSCPSAFFSDCSSHTIDRSSTTTATVR